MSLSSTSKPVQVYDVDDVTWRELIAKEMSARGDLGPIVACTLSDDEMDAGFDDSWGMSSGRPFTAWTERRVYFPAVYDGREWVASAPRNPCDEATRHVGGE